MPRKKEKREIFCEWLSDILASNEEWDTDLLDALEYNCLHGE